VAQEYLHFFEVDDLDTQLAKDRELIVAFVRRTPGSGLRIYRTKQLRSGKQPGLFVFRPASSGQKKSRPASAKRLSPPE
jgi:hypothetical protein